MIGEQNADENKWREVHGDQPEVVVRPVGGSCSAEARINEVNQNESVKEREQDDFRQKDMNALPWVQRGSIQGVGPPGPFAGSGIHVSRWSEQRKAKAAIVKEELTPSAVGTIEPSIM